MILAIHPRGHGLHTVAFVDDDAPPRAKRLSSPVRGTNLPPITCLAISESEDMLATGDHAGVVVVWELFSLSGDHEQPGDSEAEWVQTSVWAPPSHEAGLALGAWITGLQWQTKHTLVVGRYAGYVEVLDMKMGARGAAATSFPNHAIGLTALALGRRAGELVRGYYDGRLFCHHALLYAPPAPVISPALMQTRVAVRAIWCVAGGEDRILAGGADNVVRVWRRPAGPSSTFRLLRWMLGTESSQGVRALAASREPDTGWVVAGCTRGVLLWRGWTPFTRGAGHPDLQGSITSVHLCESDSVLVTSGPQPQTPIAVWGLGPETFVQLRRLEGSSALATVLANRGLKTESVKEDDAETEPRPAER